MCVRDIGFEFRPLFCHVFRGTPQSIRHVPENAEVG
jgi:hypothetical protein